MFFQLQVMSKDQKVLKKFITFLFNLQKHSSTWNVIFNSKKFDRVTVLKSPHVNKTAQDQFEYRIYSKKILIDSINPSIFLLVLKKIKGLSFSGISLRITGLSNKSEKLVKILSILKPNNLYFKTHSSEFCKPNKSFLKYIQMFDCYGETLLKTKYII